MEIDESKINFDVYNGLNLYSPSLGEAYAKFAWNPLGEDFRLDISFVERYLEAAKEDAEVKMPPFLENDPRIVLDSFKLATKRNKEILTELQSRYDTGEFISYKNANIEKQVEEVLFILKCRQKMFEITIGQLNAKGIDAFAAYKNIRGLNKKLSQLLEEIYAEEWNKKVALQNMLNFAQKQANEFSSLYFPKPFVFDFAKQAQRQNQRNIIEEILNSVSQVADAFLGKSNETTLNLSEMPAVKMLPNDFENGLQAPKPENNIYVDRNKEASLQQKLQTPNIERNKELLPKRPPRSLEQ